MSKKSDKRINTKRIRRVLNRAGDAIKSAGRTRFQHFFWGSSLHKDNLKERIKDE